ncbi:MAG: hypothetical protein JWL86_5185 [Rhizobium sp.]|nr:hypothetical protein [Rhizobium sp.]
MSFLRGLISRFMDALPAKADDNIDEFLKNERVRSVLRENGDDCRSPRTVQHFAYFPDAAPQISFREFLVAHGYDIDDEHNEAEGRNAWAVIFSKIQTPVKIDGETALLGEYAGRLGGDYDGWETEVVRK